MRNDELPQDVLQNAAVLVVLNLVWGVDSSNGLETLFLAIFCPCADTHEHAGLNAARNAVDVECFETGEAKGSDVFACSELQRKHSHTDQIAAVNPFEAFRDYGFDTQQPRALGSPVPR